MFPDNTNKILAKISVAARTALTMPQGQWRHYIGAGPSMRSRVRLALVVVFLVATPTLFIGVIRTEKVLQHTASLINHDDYLKYILEVKLALKELDIALWAFFSEAEFEYAQQAKRASEYLMQKISTLERERPDDIDIGPNAFIANLAQKLDNHIATAIANKSSAAPARLSMIALSKELTLIEQRVRKVAHNERKMALGILSRVGRDQLILFLILIFTLPVFIIFIPHWVIGPLSSLRHLAHNIDRTHLKDMAIKGKDEVALVARSLKAYVIHQEDLEYKKSSKIFEIRNILRSVLSRVEEPVFIIDDHFNINYTNEAAAYLIGLPSHQIEGRSIGDCLFCPLVKTIIERAFLYDISDEPYLITIEVADGRVFEREARIGVVRNRDGHISRAVMVLHEKNSSHSG
jgi:PAS domain S-box-containing protein